MRKSLEDFRIAGSFLSLLPLAGSVEIDSDRMARSMAYFPLVGFFLGAGLLLLDWGLTPILPRAVVDCLLLLALIYATGALHLDGIADLADGLASGKDRDGMLRIMKDSCVGAMGAVALVMVILLKFLSLYHTPAPLKPMALFFMPAAGRWVQVVLAFLCPYVRPGGGTGGVFVENVGMREVLVATAMLAAVTPFLFGVRGLLLFMLLVVGAMGLKVYYESRLGGVTGDVLGASTEIVEVLTLILLLGLFPV